MGFGTRPSSLLETPPGPSAQTQPQLQHVRSLSSVSAYQSQTGSHVNEFGSTTLTGFIDGNVSNGRSATFPVAGSSSYVEADANGYPYRTLDSGDHDAPPSSPPSAPGHRRFNPFLSSVPQPLASQDQQQATAGSPLCGPQGSEVGEPAPPYSESSLAVDSGNSWANPEAHIRSLSSNNPYALAQSWQTPTSDSPGGGARPTCVPASPTVMDTQEQGQKRGAPLVDQGDSLCLRQDRPQSLT